MSSARFRRVRALWPDHLGLARGKSLLPEAASTGHCVATFALGLDREMHPFTGSGFLEGLPDVRSVFDPNEVRPGWEEGTGVVVADLEFTGKKDGQPFDLSPRTILKTAVGRFGSRGWEPVVGIELEAFLLRPDGSGGFQPLTTPSSYVYGTGPGVDPDGVIDQVLEAADRAGIVVESVHSEYDDGQFELTLVKDAALQAADDAFLFRLLAREVAMKAGFHLTFLGKPFSDRGGSGLHVNLSLETEGRNLFDDPAGPSGLSPVAWKAVSGLLHHHRGLAGVVAPTVNAYKRLRPGQMSGYFANWGHDHRGVAVRIPPERGEGARIEHRLADGACGPHIAVAATLLASWLGVEGSLPLPPEETEDCWEASSATTHAAPDLPRALDDLNADRALVDALGPRFVEALTTAKRAEWERYAAWTTDWERREYLPYF